MPRFGAKYLPRLTVNSTVLDVGGFTLSAPKNGLGLVLQAELPTPDLTQIPTRASVKFEIGVWVGPTPPDYNWITLIDSGSVSRRDFVIRFNVGPDDRLSMQAVNVAADRFSLAPANPVTMYDPTLLELPPYNANAGGNNVLRVRDAGQVITPAQEPIGGLNLKQILDRVYTNKLPQLSLVGSVAGAGAGSVNTFASTAAGTGCGFTRVVTNIPNFPVTRVDVTMEGGWHAAAAGLLSPFDPLYFSDDGLTLYIISKLYPLPTGLQLFNLPLACVAEVSQSEEWSEFTNRIIVSYQSNEEIVLSYTERLDQSGDTISTIRDYYDSNGVVVNSVVTKTEKKTYGTVDGANVLIGRTTQQDTFNTLGLKTGHTKKVEALILDPALSNNQKTLMTVQDETCTVSWRVPQGQTGEWIQEKAITEVSGLAIELDGDNGKERYPALPANQNYMIKQDGTTPLVYKQLKRITETLRGTGSLQTDVDVEVMDYLIPQTVSSHTSPRTGQPIIQTQIGNLKRELVKDATSIAAYGNRRALSLDGGTMPRGTVLDLAARKLNLIANPPKNFNIPLPKYDPRVRRGKLVNAYDRAGAATKAIIESYTITGTAPTDKEPYTVKMVLQASEVK